MYVMYAYATIKDQVGDNLHYGNDYYLTNKCFLTSCFSHHFSYSLAHDKIITISPSLIYLCTLQITTQDIITHMHFLFQMVTVMHVLKRMCSVPYAYLYYTRMVHTICVYAYGVAIRVWYGLLYHSRMVHMRQHWCSQFIKAIAIYSSSSYAGHIAIPI